MHRITLLSLLFLTACTTAAPNPTPVNNTPQAAAAASSASSSISSSASSISAEIQVAADDDGGALEGNEWYRNDRFGFALQIPHSLRSAGSCILTETPPEGYHITAFEDGSSIYLAPDIYGETVDKIPNDSSAGYDCVRINNTLATIRKNMQDPLFYFYGWRMIADKGIGNDDQLLAFIRAWYGPGCTLGAKTATKHAGTFDVEIIGDEGDDAAQNSDCPLNFGYKLKYSPATSTAITWKVGQDGRFDDLDVLMAETFRFE